MPRPVRPDFSCPTTHAAPIYDSVAKHDMRAHLRSEIHPYLNRQYFSPASEHPLTAEDIQARIRQGKNSLDD
jgi:hypothetical protein